MPSHNASASDDNPSRRQMLKSLLVPSLVLLAVSVLLIRIPLFNYLGYEFSAAIALFIPFFCGYVTIKVFRENISVQSATLPTIFRRTLFQSLSANLMLLAVPLLVATINLLFIKNCSYFEGLLFFLLIPVVTCVWSVSLASFSAVAFHRSRTTYYLLLTIVLLHPLYVGYTTPQIYSYNFIYGFFPGFSHDEVLVITQTLVIFRLVTLVIGALLVLLASIFCNQPVLESFLKKIFSLAKQFRFTRRHSLSVLLLILIVLFYSFREQLGIETSTTKLQHELSAQYRTEHFHIYYAPKSFSDEEIRWVAMEHEFRFQQVKDALQARFDGIIDSYIYPDADTKQRLIGTGVTNIAKPWRTEIHLNKDAWQATLKHELVHALAGEFGMPVIKAHYNLGLVEGLATAVDGDWGNRTLHEYAAAMKKFHVVENPERLIGSVGFVFQYPSLSYVMMGSFCKFLLDRYGIVRFKELYSGKSPEVVYEKSYNELAEEWQHMLSRVNVPSQWQAHTEFFFKRPSIFAKECARTIAKLNQDGWKLFVRNENEGAKKLFSKALHKSWNTESFIGLVRSCYREMRYDTVNTLLKEEFRDSLHRSGVVNLLLLYGDVSWYKGDVPLAQTMYDKLLKLDLSEQYDETIALRLAAMNDEHLRAPLLYYFTKSMSDSVSLRFLDSLQNQFPHPLIAYLKAKLFLRLRQYKNAVSSLEQLKKSLNSSILDAQKEQMLAEGYFYLKQFQQAKIHFWQSLNFITNKSSIDRVNDWLERCQWYADNAKKYLK